MAARLVDQVVRGEPGAGPAVEFGQLRWCAAERELVEQQAPKTGMVAKPTRFVAGRLEWDVLAHQPLQEDPAPFRRRSREQRSRQRGADALDDGRAQQELLDLLARGGQRLFGEEIHQVLVAGDGLGDRSGR